MKPEVSILIPVYNTAPYVQKSIESVLAQTFQNWELIIVDDASTDNTLKICKDYAQKDSRIRLYQNSQNLGMMKNWNYGLDLCQADYWGKLDADDYWAPHLIEDCLQVLKQEAQVGLVCTRYININVDDQIIEGSEYSLPEFARNKTFNLKNLVKEGPQKMLSYGIAQQGIGLMRREIFERLGKFKLIDAGDTEMWFRIGAHYDFYALDRVYHYHRIWPESFTRSQVIKQGKKAYNLFEARKEILDYYAAEDCLGKDEHRRFIRDNLYEYNKFLVYKFRNEKKIFHSMQHLWENLSLYPGRTMAFYLDRFSSRFTSQN